MQLLDHGVHTESSLGFLLAMGLAGVGTIVSILIGQYLWRQANRRPES